MREFGRRRATGEPVCDELYAKHVNTTNNPSLASTSNVTGPNGLLLVFHRSADKCSDTVRDAPETVPFELPLAIEPFMVPTPRKPAQ